MKIKILSIITIVLLSKTVFSQTNGKSNSKKITSDTDIVVLTIDKKYEGKNVFVNNPFSTRKEGGLCITDVIINNTAVHMPKDEINATTFEIPLNKYNIKLGDNVNIKIYHQNGCMPTIFKSKTH